MAGDGNNSRDVLISSQTTKYTLGDNILSIVGRHLVWIVLKIVGGIGSMDANHELLESCPEGRCP